MTQGMAECAVVVVTGGASGIGRASALAFAGEGATAVVVADLREEPREGGEPTVDLVRRLGVAASFVRCDVADPADLAAAVERAEEYGGISVMVNDAGIARTEAFLEVREADYDRMMAVNVKGTYFGAQAAARAMVRHGRGGAIVNVSSVGGLVGAGAFPTYAASKGAVRLLTLSLAECLGPMGIRVNAVYPGIVDTEMTRTDISAAGQTPASAIPLGRRGVPSDIAAAVVWLASPLAGYVNGGSLIVDGGDLRI